MATIAPSPATGAGRKSSSSTLRTDRSPHVVRSMGLSGSLIAARRIGNTVHFVVADNDSPAADDYVAAPDDLPYCRKNVRRRARKVRGVEARQRAEDPRASTPLPHAHRARHGHASCATRCRPRSTTASVHHRRLLRPARRRAHPPRPPPSRAGPGAVFASERGALPLRRAPPRGQRGGAGIASTARRTRSATSTSSASAQTPGRDALRRERRRPRARAQPVRDGRVVRLPARRHDARPRARSRASRARSRSSREATDGNLVRVGAIEHIAPVGGHPRRALRRRSRLRRHLQEDRPALRPRPLPAQPRPAILGELKIPGFSTYLHRIDPDAPPLDRLRRRRPRRASPTSTASSCSSST